MESGRIEEYEDLELVEAVAERYEDEFGSTPLNLSHWDPSAEFRAKLSPRFSLEPEMDPVNLGLIRSGGQVDYAFATGAREAFSYPAGLT